MIVPLILDRVCEREGALEIIKVDNGPEFRNKEFDKWCYKNVIRIKYSRLEKPMDNCQIESFNGTFRTECLNSHYFETLSDARKIIMDWWTEYNTERPQKRLKGMTPSEYKVMLNKLKTNPASGRIAG